MTLHEQDLGGATMSAIEEREARIDEVLVASFPASDPPPWTTGVEPTPTGPDGVTQNPTRFRESA
jgi:hypothetical protein